MLTKRFFQLIFWYALTFALVIATMQRPPVLPGDPSDKVQHVLAFLVLSGLATLAYPHLSILAIFVGLAFFGGVIEAIQAFPNVGRKPSWLDWFADVIAAAAGLLIVSTFRFLRRDRGTKI